MDINLKKKQEDKFFKEIYPIAEDKIRCKTNAELERSNYLLHFYFLRFAFAVLSFSLYIPTLIELFQTSISFSDYVRNFIIVLLLLILEIGLSMSLKDYFIRFHSDNSNRKRLITFMLAGLSVILSALSGVNAIQILDKSENQIISETRNAKKQDLNRYTYLLKQNAKKIELQNKNIAGYNQAIKNTAPIAATKAGKKQIAKAQFLIEQAQKNIAEIEQQNAKYTNIIEDIRSENKNMLKTRLSKAGKKELIYMIIFFFAGFVAVFGLMFSYNFIGKYYRYVRDEARHIAALKIMLQNAENEQERNEIEAELNDSMNDFNKSRMNEDFNKINHIEKKNFQMI